MNRAYCKIVDGGKRIEFFPGWVELDGRIWVNPSDEQKARAGWLKNAQNAPEAREGYVARLDGYEARDGKIYAVYTCNVATPNISSYNRVVENHLKSERIARGYDTREPSLYVNSSIPRWRQDAQDWIAHVDSVMSYALSALNDWKAGGDPPALREFAESLPKIKWTVED